MKMIMAIVNRADEKPLAANLMKGGFAVTKISSTGGLLKTGNITLITVVNTERLPKALQIIRSTTKANKYTSADISTEAMPVMPEYKNEGERREVVVGGASVFVLNVEESYKF